MRAHGLLIMIIQNWPPERPPLVGHSGYEPRYDTVVSVGDVIGPIADCLLTCLLFVFIVLKRK